MTADEKGVTRKRISYHAQLNGTLLPLGEGVAQQRMREVMVSQPTNTAAGPRAYQSRAFLRTPSAWPQA